MHPEPVSTDVETPAVGINLFPDEPPSMFAIDFVRKGLVPVGRDKFNRIVRDEIPHVEVGNRRLVSTYAVSQWLLGHNEAPTNGEGCVVHMVPREPEDRG